MERRHFKVVCHGDSERARGERERERERTPRRLMAGGEGRARLAARMGQGLG